VANPGTEFDPVYGGWNPALVLPDISQLFGIDTRSSGVSELVDPATAAGGLDAAMSLDLGAAEWIRSRRDVSGLGHDAEWIRSRRTVSGSRHVAR
jgi:hypothetical protein